MYLSALKNYKPTPIKAGDEKGHVKEFSAPKAPHSPEEADLQNGLKDYENQQPDLQPEFNLRGVFVTDAQGAFHYRTVRPGGYRVPDDGPVGRLMAGLGLPLRRPAHLHFRIGAEGFETVTTQLYDRADPDLARDPIFGVKQPLVVDIVRAVPAPRYALPEPLDGPEYADILLSTRRGSSLLTYLLLSLVYFTLLGVMLIPERSGLIALLGLTLMVLTVLGERYLQRRRLEKRMGGTVSRLPWTRRL